MRFIDIFDVLPEKLPDGKDIDDVIGFLNTGGFREEFVNTCWRGFSKSYERFFLWVKIYKILAFGKCAVPNIYIYEFTVRMVGDPASFRRKYDNFREGMIDAGRYMVDSENDGNTGNSVK